MKSRVLEIVIYLALALFFVMTFLSGAEYPPLVP